MRNIKWSTLLVGWYSRINKQPVAIRSIIGAMALVVLLALFYLIYTLTYLGKVYPNVYIGSEKFGGLTLNETKEKLAALSARVPEVDTTLQHQDKTSVLSPEEFEWQMEADKTAEMIYRLGRADSGWASLLQQLRMPFSRTNLTVIASYDVQLLDNRITEIAETIDQPAVNASAKFVNDSLVITREQVGKKINREEVRDGILEQWGSFTGGAISLELQFDAPTVVLGDKEELEAMVERLSGSQLTLSWPNGKKTLSRREIRQLIDFPGVEPVSPSTDVEDGQQLLTAAFTEEQSRVFLEPFSKDINSPAEEPKLVIRNGQLAVDKPAKEGRVVDANESAKRIVLALTAEPAVNTAELLVKVQQPVISETNLSELGIKERIGYGETSFVGSPPNRRHNINNGVTLLQSALIKPGGEFSTVKTLGAVDDTTGFLPELVIKENRTTPEFGGGLCQVSTTLFRAVMNAGMKVTERQNHSYRVSYYEPPVGLDATIYLPKPDFRFVNDTPAHVLVQGRVQGNKVIFELWGTSDGRVSSISDPQILSTSPAGDPIYAETDTLPKGEVKQIEKPHDGAVTIAYYTVTRDGQVINKQTFKSVYKAWPARFLVGTNEMLPPSIP